MKQKAKNLKSLGDISEMILDARLAELARMSHNEQQLCNEIRKLTETPASIQPGSPIIADLANAAKWMRWRQDRKGRLNGQLAVLKSDREAILHGARRAFGRVQAIRLLESRMK